MIGGTMKTTSRFALAAAAGLFVGAMAFTPAKAADLGGDCCADLEERVAELEATTVRKGNRVMSVTLSGNVNTGILIWDDGVDSDAYVVDNDFSGTDFQITGSSSLKPGWTVGYRMDIDVDFSGSADVNANEGDGDGDDIGAQTVELDNADAYIESQRFGRITLGLTDMASDGIAEISLSSAGNNYHCTSGCMAGNFAIRGGSGNGETWGAISSALDGFGDTEAVRYDSPSIAGFILSASAGEDDRMDAALRFSKQWNSIQIAAGVAYAVDAEDDPVGAGNTPTIGQRRDQFTQISGSASIKHVPTGLYAIVSGGEQDYEGADSAGVNTASSFYGSVGVSQNWFGPGDTTLYGEYASYEDFGVNGSSAEMLSLGFAQDFDAAATEIFIVGQHWTADDTYGSASAFASTNTSGAGTNAINCSAGQACDTEEFFGVMTGMNVNF